MNKRIILSVLLLALPCLGAHAQAPDVTIELGVERATTVVSTTGTNVVYKFGVDTRINTVPSPVTYPLIVDCNTLADCNALGGDPAPGIGKALFAVEQATPYTVTLAGVPTPVTVPGNPALAAATPTLPAPAACLPITMPSAQVLPRNCILSPNAVAIGSDGALVAIDMNSQPMIYLQYCQGTVCNPPFVWTRQPLIVGPNPSMGGATGGTGVGTLYAFPGQGAVTITTAAGPAAARTLSGGSAMNISK